MAEFHKSGVNIPSLARFDTFMKAFMDQNGVKPIRGAVLAVTSGDRLVFARGYVRDKKADGVMTPTALFRIASSTKPITGIAIHQLFEKDGNVLSADDKVAPIVGLKRPDGTAFKSDPAPTNLSDNGNYFSEVTIKQLLTHQTGLMDGLGGLDFTVAEAFKEAQNAPAIKLPVDKYQVASWGVDQGQAFFPGSAVKYSNLEYSLLGIVLEKKTGRSYTSTVNHTVFGPVGVTRARRARTLQSKRAPGEATYHAVADADVDKPDVLGISPTPVPIPYGGENFENKDSYGGWVLSAVDYARVLASFKTSRPLVKKAVKDLLFWWNSPKPPTGPGVKAYRHGAVVPGSAGVIGLRDDGFSISLYINTTKAKEGYVFQFEGATFNNLPGADSDHELQLYKIIEEMQPAAWPAHDLFPLHGVPANVTDVAATGADSFLLAVRDRNEGLRVTDHTKVGWQRSLDLDGRLVTPPRVVSWGEGHREVFALGRDRALWHIEHLPGETWGKWKSLGGDLESEPCVISPKPKQIDVFAVGKDHDLRHFRRDAATGWGSSGSLRGVLTTPPSAVSIAPNLIDVFALDENYALQHIFQGPTGWGDWKSLGGDLRSYPQAIARPKVGIDVFAVGVDRTLMHLALKPTIAAPKWESLGGDLRCAPTVVSWGPHRLDVLAIDANGDLLHLPFEDGWGAWAKIEGHRLSSRPAAVSTQTGRIDVVAANFEQQVVHVAYRHPVGWGQWDAGGGGVG